MLVILYRTEPDGRKHYYSIDDRQSQLFAPFSLTVRWGLSPEGGRNRHYEFASLAAKNQMIRWILVKKLKSYQVLYSYFKERQEGLRLDDHDGILAKAGLRL